MVPESNRLFCVQSDFQDLFLAAWHCDFISVFSLFLVLYCACFFHCHCPVCPLHLFAKLNCIYKHHAAMVAYDIPVPISGMENSGRICYNMWLKTLQPFEIVDHWRCSCWSPRCHGPTISVADPRVWICFWKLCVWPLIQHLDLFDPDWR